MEEDCGGGQGLSWAAEPKRERHCKYTYSRMSTADFENCAKSSLRICDRY